MMTLFDMIREDARRNYIKQKSMNREIDRNHWMVRTLYEEIHNSSITVNKFTDRDKGFIDDLAVKFYNDPNYKLSEKQESWLENLYDR